MSNIDMALDAVAFMETHLTEDISVGDMADAVSFSLFHFSRVFSRTTHHSPYDYLMRRRLCEAARQLVMSNEKIIDIALTYRFHAPETFSRAFRRLFGLQPKQARSGQAIDKRRWMPSPTRQYLEFLNGDCPPRPFPATLPAMHIVGVANRITLSDPGGERQRLWHHLDRQLDTVALDNSDRQRYGILLYDPASPTEEGTYLAGMACHEATKTPTLLLEKHFAGGTYARFDLPEQTDAAQFTRDYVYHTWWPKTTTSPPGLIEIECWSNHEGDPVALSNPRAIFFPLPVDIGAPKE